MDHTQQRNYMNELTREEVSTVFKARTRMLYVKTSSEISTTTIYAELAELNKKHRTMC